MIVEVTRGDLVESVHHVAACAATPRGEVILQTGAYRIAGLSAFNRQAVHCRCWIEAGVRDAFDLDMREIAVMSASHVAQPFHIDAVRSILEKIGLDESALQCGAQEGRGPSPLYNNCSGKHAGILALCRVLGSDVATYMDANNPAQRHILGFCARLSDDDPATWPLGVDGCGIPVYATSLRKAAMAFARFASLTQLEPRDAMALLVVRDAMVSHPEYVSGTVEFDTRADGGRGRRDCL